MISSDRFRIQEGFRIVVQVPQEHASELIDAVIAVDPLKYGDYDTVSFVSGSGVQRFRSLGSGRNKRTEAVVEVSCVELSFFVGEFSDITQILETLYRAHPYEEPVIFVTETRRTCHIRGMDEDNPNKFWNRPTPDWVPADHRKSGG